MGGFALQLFTTLARTKIQPFSILPTKLEAVPIVSYSVDNVSRDRRREFRRSRWAKEDKQWHIAL